VKKSNTKLRDEKETKNDPDKAYEKQEKNPRVVKKQKAKKK